MLFKGDASSLAGSEATKKIRNTSGKANTKKKSSTARKFLDDDVEADTNPQQQQGSLPVFVEGSTYWDDEKSAKRECNKRSKCFAWCTRTQCIICFLATLLVFGVITLAVSLTMARQQSTEQEADEIQLTDSSFESDDVVNFSFGINPDTGTNTPVDTSKDDLVASPAPTKGPSQAPTLEATILADLESLLVPKPSLAPTTTATPSPTLSPSITSTSPTGTQTTSPTETPKAIAVSFTATSPPLATQSPTWSATQIPTQPLTLSPTERPTPKPSPGPTRLPTVRPTRSPTKSPTTSAPTVYTPLLEPNTILQQEVKLMGEQGGDAMGSAVALSGNGQILVVGSPNAGGGGGTDTERAGRVQIFERFPKAGSNDVWEWTPRGTIQGAGAMNELGFSVASNDDGSVVAVSEPAANSRRGRVFLYAWRESEGVYMAKQELSGQQEAGQFGTSISLSGDGRRLAVGSPYYSVTTDPDLDLKGKVDVFEYSDTSQQWQAMDTNNNPNLFIGSAWMDWFGWSVALSQDGQMLAVGAPRNMEFGGYVQCFQWSTDSWEFMGAPIMNTIPPMKKDDRFGHAVSFTNTGSNEQGYRKIARVAIGAPWKDVGDVLNSGMVAIYEFSDSKWVVDVGEALGGVFIENAPGFYHQFGYSLQMQGDAIAVGIPGRDNRRGMVDIFWLSHAFSKEAPDSSGWEHLSNSALTGDIAGDDFGFSVGLSLQTHGEGSETPSSLSIAAGGVMVSAASPASSPGYSKVYHTGD